MPDLANLLVKADLCFKNKDYGNAARLYMQLLKESPKEVTSIKPKLAGLFWNYGNILCHEGKGEPAIKYIKEAIKLYKEMDMPYKIFMATRRLGHAEGMLGNHDESIRITNSLIKDFKKIMSKIGTDHPKGFNKTLEYAKIIYYLSISWAKKANWHKARFYTALAKRYFKKIGDLDYYNSCIYGEGISLIELGKCEQAMKTLTECRAFFKGRDKKRVAFIDEYVSECLYKFKKYDEAISIIDGAIKVFTANKIERSRPYFLKGKNYEKLDEPQKAYNEYSIAIKIVENKRSELEDMEFRTTFFAEKMDIYNHAILNRIKLDKIEEAYDLVQRAKARCFNEIMEGDVVTLASMPVNGIQVLIDSKSAVVEYYCIGKELVIFLITKTSFNFIMVPYKKEDIIETPANLNEFIKCFDKESLTWYIVKISDLIFGPVEAKLNGTKKIIFIPHLALHHIPFALLVDNNGNKIIEKYEIINLPSPRLLKILKARSFNEKTNCLIVADPTGDLIYSDKEAEYIKDILPDSEVIFGKSAAREVVLELIPDYSILHFACHLGIDKENPILSHMCMSKSYIEVRDILKEKLCANMVVLGGCESALGKVVPGDEITCFARAFLRAGANSVIVTLWEIDDESTAEFMKEFYGRIYKQKESRSEALRNTQLDFISKGFEPYHWAAFQLVGG